MNTERFALVPFHGQHLTTVQINGQPHVALKPICDAIGIDWSSQLKRIKRDPVLSTCMVVTTMQVPGELQFRDVMTMPLGHLNGFLFGISVSRLGEPSRSALISYQQECYQVLHDYWTKGSAINPRLASPAASASEIIRLIAALKKERNRAARQTLHELLDQMCRAQGVSTPALEALGLADPGHEDIQAEWWQAWHALSAAGLISNHHRREGLIAVHMKEFRAGMAKLSIRKPFWGPRVYVALRDDPRFVQAGPVSCVDGRFRECWVFGQEEA